MQGLNASQFGLFGDNKQQTGWFPLQLTEQYAAELERQVLPVELEDLEGVHQTAMEQAVLRFGAEKFGTEASESTGSLRCGHSCAPPALAVARSWLTAT